MTERLAFVVAGFASTSLGCWSAFAQHRIEEIEVGLSALGSSADESVTMGEQQPAKIGELGSTAALATRMRDHHRFLESMVELVDQRPRLAVGHFHETSGRRDGPQFVDFLQKLELSAPEAAVSSQINADN